MMLKFSYDPPSVEHNAGVDLTAYDFLPRQEEVAR